MAEPWFLSWGNPPADDAPIDREWGDVATARNLRGSQTTVDGPPPLPEVLGQTLPATARIRTALLKMRGGKPGSAIVGTQAMTLVDLFGSGRAGRLVATNAGWRVDQ